LVNESGEVIVRRLGSACNASVNRDKAAFLRTCDAAGDKWFNNLFEHGKDGRRPTNQKKTRKAVKKKLQKTESRRDKRGGNHGFTKYHTLEAYQCAKNINGTGRKVVCSTHGANGKGGGGPFWQRGNHSCGASWRPSSGPGKKRWWINVE